MAEIAYEGMFIIDANRYGRDPGGLANQISELITKRGGTILVSRLWEERRLAYPINGQRKGTYWLTYFRMDSNELTTLNREIHLNENIVRSLILKVDARIIDTLVEHAKAGPAEAARARRPEPAPVVAAVAAVEGPEEELGN
ncbi:MAG TPA: 30S ribosomal protein S6 [Pirellulales bacterium]|nr:30S ribosomal protein S6 [Pirellulales bacterium]